MHLTIGWQWRREAEEADLVAEELRESIQMAGEEINVLRGEKSRVTALHEAAVCVGEGWMHEATSADAVVIELESQVTRLRSLLERSTITGSKALDVVDGLQRDVEAAEDAAHIAEHRAAAAEKHAESSQERCQILELEKVLLKEMLSCQHNSNQESSTDFSGSEARLLRSTRALEAMLDAIEERDAGLISSDTQGCVDESGECSPESQLDFDLFGEHSITPLSSRYNTTRYPGLYVQVYPVSFGIGPVPSHSLLCCNESMTQQPPSSTPETRLDSAHIRVRVRVRVIFDACQHILYNSRSH